MEFFEKDFGKILKDNAQQIRELDGHETDCMRVYDRNLVQFPVAVDLYGKYVKITDYGNETDKEKCMDICSRMLYFPIEHVFYQKRDKNQTDDETKETVYTEVLENGLKFKVELNKGLDTGLFLDHSVTRQFIREKSFGLEVLNLFSYTGSFSVYAAAGGAKSVTSVDLSNTYSKWCEENLGLNSYFGSNYQCVTKDATEFVKETAEKHIKYDLIIFDPPSFSNSHKMDKSFNIEKDWVDWLVALGQILRKSGMILFSTNLSTFLFDKKRIKGYKIVHTTDVFMAPGFKKRNKGQVRSWILEKNDDLVIRWDDNEKKDGYQKKEFGNKSQGKRRFDDSRKPYGERGRRDFNKRDRKPYDRNNRSDSYEKRDDFRKSYDENDRRDFSRRDRKPYDRNSRFDSYEKRDDFRKSYDENDRRDFNRRDRKPYERDERPSSYRRNDSRKPYGERSRSNFDRRDRKPYERDSFGKRDDFSKSYEDNDGKSFGRRDRKPSDYRRESGDRSFSKDRYGSRREGGYSSSRRDDRKKFNSDRSSDRKPYDKNDGYKPKKVNSKPYGFDDFKPAKTRDDDDKFFWLDD